MRGRDSFMRAQSSCVPRSTTDVDARWVGQDALSTAEWAGGGMGFRGAAEAWPPPRRQPASHRPGQHRDSAARAPSASVRLARREAAVHLTYTSRTLHVHLTSTSRTPHVPYEKKSEMVTRLGRRQHGRARPSERGRCSLEG
eukprot:6207153-Pleurochrysis_carterae.AAC.3